MKCRTLSYLSHPARCFHVDLILPLGMEIGETSWVRLGLSRELIKVMDISRVITAFCRFFVHGWFNVGERERTKQRVEWTEIRINSANVQLWTMYDSWYTTMIATLVNFQGVSSIEREPQISYSDSRWTIQASKRNEDYFILRIHTGSRQLENDFSTRHLNKGKSSLQIWLRKTPKYAVISISSSPELLTASYLSWTLEKKKLKNIFILIYGILGSSMSIINSTSSQTFFRLSPVSRISFLFSFVAR